MLNSLKKTKRRSMISYQCACDGIPVNCTGPRCLACRFPTEIRHAPATDRPEAAATHVLRTNSAVRVRRSLLRTSLAHGQQHLKHRDGQQPQQGKVGVPGRYRQCVLHPVDGQPENRLALDADR